MTSNIQSEEAEAEVEAEAEAETISASSVDPNKAPQQEQKSNDETTKIAEGASNSVPIESVGETTSETPVAEKQTVGKQTIEEVSGETSLLSLKANKKNKKALNPKEVIETPNVHDVLLGRGKPVSRHSRYSHDETNNETSTFSLNTTHLTIVCCSFL